MKVPFLLVVVLFCVPFAQAQTATITLNFDNLIENTKVTTQFAGMTFTNATVVAAGFALNEFEFPPRSGNKIVYNDGGTMMVSFALPATSVAGYFTYNGRLTLTAFDAGGNQIGTVSSQFTNNLALSGGAGSQPNEFLSLSLAAGIARITIAGTGTFALDDFRVTQTAAPLAYEGDVSPRPNGNQSLTMSDWVQAGRFAIGLDTLVAGEEYQRADCAPRSTKGDGIINITDWVQAGRYAAGLDPLTSTGGPTTLVSFATLASTDHSEGQEIPRAMAAVPDARENDVLLIQLEAQGNENALGFSLSFDANVMEFISATLESAGNGASLITNQSQERNGKVGIALAFPPGMALPSKTLALLKVRFKPLGTSVPASTTVRFGDTPTRRTVVDLQANSLPGTYADAVLPLRAREGTSRRGTTRR